MAGGGWIVATIMAGECWLVGAARAGGGEAGGRRDLEDEAERDHPAGPNYPRPGSLYYLKHGNPQHENLAMFAIPHATPFGSRFRGQALQKAQWDIYRFTL
ncbi:hypothetical protein ZWY2020_011477 [Hordeum vulgare]|nr:hypothetical protein ZWY2020_011477 [Hordeum vulgare]